MKIKLLVMLLLTLFLCSCGAKRIPKQDGHGPDLKVYMVDIDGYLANLLENGDELKKQFGNKISSDYYDTNAIAASSFGDVFEEYICNGLTSTYNENSNKLMLYNGITTKTSEEDLKKVLNENYLSFESFNLDYTDYIEIFINDTEINYSLIDISEFEEVGDECLKYIQAGIAYCVKQLENSDNGNFTIISYSCHDGADNKISIRVFQKERKD